jgi:DNA-binding response OmpR family regulator
MRTLVVHPDGMTAKLLRFILNESGHEVVLLKRAEQCLRAARERETDAVLLTVALPDRDGFALCQELRKQRYPGPVIVLTPQEATSEKLRAFAAGADDVIGEPFDPAELVVRLEAISRRCRPLEQQALGTVLTVGEAELSLSDLLFRVGDQEPVPLTPTELRLLECLMRNQGIIISRQRLTERIWGQDSFGESNRIDVYVRRVRKKIERDPDHPAYFQTVRGLGYRFQASEAAAMPGRGRLCVGA